MTSTEATLLAQPKPYRARRPDHQDYDEIVIRTEPRYKTSSFSGNEWRISATATILRKGKKIAEYDASTVPELLQEVSRRVFKRKFQEASLGLDTSEFCDQEGCKEPFTRTYKMLQEQSHGPRCSHLQDPFQPTVRKFCERHAKRGDCGLEDQDRNYEQIDGPKDSPQMSTEDESKAVSLFLYDSDSDW